MKCPNCGAENPDGSEDCRSCNIFFAKWQKRAEAAPRADEPPAAAPPASEGSSGRAVFLLAGLLAAAGIAALAYKSLQPGEPRPGAGLVSPAPYRGEIAALENALYKDEPANLQDAMAVENASGQLLQKLLVSRRLRRHESVEKLSILGAMVNSEGLTYAATARRDWTAEWEEIRDALFEKADWFHAPVFVSQAAAAAADQNLAGISMQRAVAWTDRLIAEARAETQQFGDEEVNLRNLKAGPANAARLESWRAWVPFWQQRVAAAASSLPDPKTLSAFELQETHRALSQVLALLASPPDPGAGAFLTVTDPLYKARYLPGRNSREPWLNNAANWMNYPRSIVQKSTGPGQDQAGK